VADFSARTREVRNESSEARLRMQREVIALGNEITQLRASATSLTNGVMKAMQIIGFIREEAHTAGTTEGQEGKDGEKKSGKEGDAVARSIEVEDLLEWEKVGKSLATRIARNWYQKESAGIPSLLAMVERKAETSQLEGLKQALSDGSLNVTMASYNSGASTRATPDDLRSPVKGKGVESYEVKPPAEGPPQGRSRPSGGVTPA